MRTVKEAAERRNEILDVAEELFALNGYDATSTNDILSRIGIARGTLYYHFESKESILDALINRITGGLLAKARMIASESDFSVVDRMVQCVMALNVDSPIGAEVMEQVHKPQNALMHQKMQENLLSGIVPIIIDLVEEGIKEGIFKTDYPTQTVEMIMIYSSEAFDSTKQQTKEQMRERVYAFIYNTERLLCAKPGSLIEPMKKIFE